MNLEYSAVLIQFEGMLPNLTRMPTLKELRQIGMGAKRRTNQLTRVGGKVERNAKLG